MGEGTVKGPHSGARRCCGDPARNWRIEVNGKLLGQVSQSILNIVIHREMQSCVSQSSWLIMDQLLNQLTGSLDGPICLPPNPTVNQRASQSPSQTDRLSDTESLNASQLNDTMWFAVPILRSLSGCSLFVRVEVVLRGATFHVLFTDASQLPPPFRIDNLSEVWIFCDTF